MTPYLYNLSSVRLPLTGIGRYAVELLTHLAEIRSNTMVVRNGACFSVEGQTDTDAWFETRKGGWSAQNTPQLTQKLRNVIGSIPLSRSIYRAMDRRRFYRTARQYIANGAYVHDLNYSLSPTHSRVITTVYDISHVTHPQTHPRHRVNYLNHYFKKLASSMTPIITISEAVKSELIQQYDIDECRVHVTHLAASDDFEPRSAASCNPILEGYDLAYKKYVLCVATLEPRKNLSAVVDAYEALDPNVQIEFPLVIVGADGWKNSALAQRIQRLQRSGHVRYLGYVPEMNLPTVYAGASVFVYPSLYEGFGLPVLEAMQSGCPCITSNRGALAEVADHHALQVNPLDSAEIADALSTLLLDDNKNARFSAGGLQRARQFSWHQTAQETDRIYHHIENMAR